MIVNELKKGNSGSFKSLDEVGTNEYQFDLEIDIETAIIHSELEKRTAGSFAERAEQFDKATAGGIVSEVL